jgi:hypothetical protein
MEGWLFDFAFCYRSSTFNFQGDQMCKMEKPSLA